MTVIWHPVATDDHAAGLALPAPGEPLSPEAAKDLACRVALRGVGRVAPNPLVGAVVVDRAHRFLAAGAHERLGGPHAEVNAFSGMTTPGAAAGGTLYVTLEPCAHANRTPACAPQVAASGLARVVYGLVDPNPKVNGRGAAIVTAAGIDAVHDRAWSPACERLTEVFLWHVRHGTPFVGLKVAAGLDGVMARQGDQRAWITGLRARAHGHFLRLWYDAVLIGQGTLVADDPTLDARMAAVAGGRLPQRVVLDPDGRGALALPAPRVATQAPEGVLWLTGTALGEPARAALAGLAGRGVTHLELPTGDGGLMAPEGVLAALAARGLTSVLLEGGEGVYGSFLRAGCVDRLHLYQAPTLFGASGTVNFAAGLGNATVTRRPGLPVELTPLGDDWLTEVALTRGVPRDRHEP